MKRNDDKRKQFGFDELNLAEFPMASISSRFLDSTKTIVFDDEVWDRDKKKRVPRNLTLSGSDRYGLPTAKDDDVLLACIQLSSFSDFKLRDVSFSRYELLKLLRLPDSTKNYRRISDSLRRWTGLTVYSNRAFYDKQRNSWVNKDFGIFDNLFIYERESEEGSLAPASSWFRWNETIFESFQAGYLKRIDWDLYLRLKSPVAKRLYRFLDKRFYHGGKVEIDLHELAIRKVRLSPNGTASQLKRELSKGISELETEWDLKRCSNERRFIRVGKGKWRVLFERSRRQVQPIEQSSKPKNEQGLEFELQARGVSMQSAINLATKADQKLIKLMLELFDWYNKVGQARGAGFLVKSILEPKSIVFPTGFHQSSNQPSQPPSNSRIRPAREFNSKQMQEDQAKEKKRWQAFNEFLAGLSDIEKKSFEYHAIENCDPVRMESWNRMKRISPEIGNAYLSSILLSAFEDQPIKQRVLSQPL